MIFNPKDSYCFKTSSNSSKILYNDSRKRKVDYINPYLSTAKVKTIPKRKIQISGLKEMVLGNMPNCYGGLQFSSQEREELTNRYPITNKYLKKVIGSKELIRGTERWCLWINDEDYKDVKEIPPLAERFKMISRKREESKKASYIKFAGRPYRFVEIRHKVGPVLIIPGTSSENREYIPIGFADEKVIINNLAFAVYKPESYLFSIITSKMHMLWIKNVCGSLETRIRYSSVLGYNTFPFPKISRTMKDLLLGNMFEILEEREKYSDKTLAELYNKEKIPTGLKEAHLKNDISVEKCYRQAPFTNDNERLDYLFSLYEQMIELEQNENTLFADVVKKKRKRRINA